MTKKQLQQADKKIDVIYRENCSGIEIDVFDIGKIFTVGRGSIEAGDEDAVLTQKIVDFVQKIRKN